MAYTQEQTSDWSLTGLPLPLILRPSSPFTDDELIAFSRRNKPYRIKRNQHGELVIMTPVGNEGGRRELRVASALMLWADEDGTGEADGSNAGWNLPDGSTLSPDACWTKSSRITRFTPDQTERYLPSVLISLLRSVPEAITRGRWEQRWKRGSSMERS